ncbi:MAG: RraA family protein [Oscillibacter sp.]|uniref:RraA family protein n=1 Tax=Oscillibacter sp. TaxID=1945593 RepID=UPI00132AF5C6|nr:RraA family protein [Oscillibacter sp.]MUU13163.1 RraA family protein [Oscillibacter sp.]
MDREFWMGPSFPQQPRELLNRLKSYGVCVVADALKGFNAMNGSIQPVVPGKCICGCAVTVRLHPGDNLLLHKAIESAQPGDILVLDTNSSYRRAVIGGIMSGAAFGKGIGGLVVDGAVRDVEELRAHGWPVFAAAVVPCAADSDGPGQLESPHQLRRCAGPSGRYHPGG